MAEPAYQRLLIDAGIEPVLDSNPEKLRQTLAADVALWAPVVKSSDSRSLKFAQQNVRYWHKADIASCTAHVRFWR